MRKPEDYAAPVEGPLPVDDEIDEQDEEKETVKPRSRRKRTPGEDKPVPVQTDAQHGTWHPDVVEAPRNPAHDETHHPDPPPKPEEDWAHRTSHQPLSDPDKPRGV